MTPESQLQAEKDGEMIAQFLSSNEFAFAELVERHKDAVRCFVRAFVGGIDDVDDLAQEVFVEVYRSIGRYRGESLFTTWLYSLARNVCLHRLRSRLADRRRALRVDSEELLDIPDPCPGHETVAENEESRQLVRKAMEMLPDGHRVVLVLSHWEGLPYAEIARILDIPEGTVKSRAHNAVIMLAARLKPVLGVEEA